MPWVTMAARIYDNDGILINKGGCCCSAGAGINRCKAVSKSDNRGGRRQSHSNGPAQVRACACACAWLLQALRLLQGLPLKHDLYNLSDGCNAPAVQLQMAAQAMHVWVYACGDCLVEPMHGGTGVVRELSGGCGGVQRAVCGVL